MMCEMSKYTEAGFEGRYDYLEFLSNEYGVSIEDVFALASLLGSGEDFDGLLNALEGE